MEDQIGRVLHWNHQKKPKTSKKQFDEVIMRNLDRIPISAAAALLSNPSRYSQESLIQKKKKKKKSRSK